MQTGRPAATEALDDFEKNQGRMWYGCPRDHRNFIGSGGVETAGTTVVAQR